MTKSIKDFEKETNRKFSKDSLIHTMTISEMRAYLADKSIKQHNEDVKKYIKYLDAGIRKSFKPTTPKGTYKETEKKRGFQYTIERGLMLQWFVDNFHFLVAL